MALATHHPMVLNAQLSSYVEGALGRATAVQLSPRDTYTSGGFVESWATNEVERGRPRRHDVVMDPTQLRYLARILTLLGEHNVKALLVWAPVTSAYRDAVENLEDIRGRLTEVSQAHGVPFVDLNGRVALNEALDFFDRDHLNQRGVDKVMPVFADVLSELQLLGEDGRRSGID
jgi:hypothetical protein